MPRTTPAGRPYVVAADGRPVTVQKVFTRMGERLELTAEALGRSTRLDAMMLESVTWQDGGELAARGAGIDRSDALATPPTVETDEREEPITISNEFALAHVEKVAGDEGAVLRVAAPKLGYSVDLEPAALEWLALQDDDTFTTWLETPFGPGADDHGH